jgi:hypothetical protein
VLPHPLKGHPIVELTGDLEIAALAGKAAGKPFQGTDPVCGARHGIAVNDHSWAPAPWSYPNQE